MTRKLTTESLKPIVSNAVANAGLTTTSGQVLRPKRTRIGYERKGRAETRPSQYGTYKPGGSLAEKEGTKTAMTGQPRLTANPKSGAAPGPATDALDYVVAGEKLERLRAETALNIREVRRAERLLYKELKYAVEEGDRELERITRKRLKTLLDERVRYVGKLHREEEAYADWGVARRNKGFMATRGFLAGKDIVAGQSNGARTSRGKWDAEKISQEKARH